MKQEQHSFKWFSGLLIIATLVFGVVVGKGWEPSGYASESYEELQIFAEVLTQVKKHYVEESETKSLVYGAIRGMLAGLDPHSSYMTSDMYKEMQVETKGEFGGLGIQIGIKNHRLTVIAPIEDTPAHAAGIQAGDVISHVNGKPTKDLTLMEAVQQLRGLKGTQVSLSVFREGVTDLLEFTITRDIIKIHSVRSKVLEDTIGYVRITQFQEATPRDLGKTLNELREKNVQALIVDLRNNPGGLLTAAVGVSEYFLPADKLIVSIKGRNGRKDEYRASLEEEPYTYPMIVLVNEGSASASEIVAAAMQDWGKAVIVGKTTFGKGSVQTILPLTDGSGLRLTTAKYYTPSGESIHSIGVKPDIVVDPAPVTMVKNSSGELNAESKTGVGSTQSVESNGGVNVPKTEESLELLSDKEAEAVRNDVQLQKAIELLKTWKVFKHLRPL